MQRRTFLSIAGAMGLGAASSQLKHYYLRHERELLQLAKQLRGDYAGALILEATAAAHMPQILVVPALESAEMSRYCSLLEMDRRNRLSHHGRHVTSGCSPVFELRTYRAAPAKQLVSANIKPIYQSNQTYLIPFASLFAREQAWSEFGACEAEVSSISIFKPAA